MTKMIAFIHLVFAWYCASIASASLSVVALVKLVHSGSGSTSIVCMHGVVIVSNLAWRLSDLVVAAEIRPE